MVRSYSLIFAAPQHRLTALPGPPADVINGPDNDSNVAIVQAVLNNKSNGVYVYNHYTRGPWYSAQVRLSSYDCAYTVT